MRRYQHKLYRALLILILTVLSTSILPIKAEENDFNKIKLPPVEAFRLKNGGKVFYIQEELPKISIIASIGFGTLYEKKENAGISDLLAKTLSLGGSKKYPGQKLHETIDFIGGKISISSSYEGTYISIIVLKKYIHEAFDIMADILENPNFEEKYISKARSLINDRIKRKQDDPASVAIDKTKEKIFNGIGYGAIPTEAGINSYTKEMLIEAWKKHFTAQNMLIGISSSVNFREIKKRAEQKLSGLPRGKQINYIIDPEETREAIKKNRGKIFFIPKNIPQSTIVVGTAAPSISYKGAYSLTLMNYILGGGSFTSRLMKEIRVKRGLAYSVQSISRFRRNTGLFLAFAQTKNDKADTVLTLLLDNISKMGEKEVAAEELEWAKQYINNSYIFRFDTPLNILSNYIDIEYNNLPKDYYTTYLDFINKTGTGDIRKESASLLENGLIKVVVGGPEVKKLLGKFGEVVELKEE
ncbi:MAG: insulinase family protein [bacterium]|nr:insulinase family protein [bacterium]